MRLSWMFHLTMSQLLSFHTPANRVLDISTSLQLVLNIGEIYSKAKTPAEFNATMQSLTAAQKYKLMTKHKVPHKNHIFPTQYLGSCNRSFRLNWLSENSWMVYSEKVDGAFCIVCALFCSDPSKGYLVSKPFRIWNKKSENQRARPIKVPSEVHAIG